MPLTKVTYAMIKDNPINVMDYGAVGDGVADDYAAIQAAVDIVEANGGGFLYLPEGTYKISEGIALPSDITFYGSGAGSTIIICSTDFPKDENAIYSNNYTGEEHTDYRYNIKIQDLTVNMNWVNRPDEGYDLGRGILFSTVQYGYITRVHVLYAMLHGIDILASVYFDNGNTNDQPDGPSLDCVVEDCYTDTTKWDDGITTHNSGRLVINRCRTYHDWDLHVPTDSQHGIEIDDGSYEVSVLDCFAENNVVGFQAKGHTTARAAQKVNFTRCTAINCVRPWEISHRDRSTLPVGQIPTALDITIRDCVIQGVNDDHPTVDSRIMYLFSYENVNIENLLAITDVSTPAYFDLGQSITGIKFYNIQMRGPWGVEWDDASGLINIQSGSSANYIQIENFFFEEAITGCILYVVQNYSISIENLRCSGKSEADVPAISVNTAIANKQFIHTELPNFEYYIQDRANSINFGSDDMYAPEIDTSYKWTFWGGAVNDPNGNASFYAPPGTEYHNVSSGSVWIKKSIYTSNTGWESIDTTP